MRYTYVFNMYVLSFAFTAAATSSSVSPIRESSVACWLKHVACSPPSSFCFRCLSNGAAQEGEAWFWTARFT